MSQETQKNKSKIPYFFFAFFAVVFAVNISYIYLANKNWRGVVTDNSYQKGIKYNETISLVKKQKALGWKTDIKYDSLGNKNGKLLVEIFDKNLKPITNANIRSYFKRPTQEGFDFDVPLIFTNGKYEAKLIFPLKGQWDFNLEISRNDDVFWEVKRYIIQ